MPFVYLVLDSAHVDYAAVVAALAAATAAKYGYAPVQVVRNAAHDPDVKIVAANITLGERTGGLAPLRRDNLGMGVYKHEFPGLASFRIRGFDMLGESIRGADGVAGRVRKYVRPARPGAANGTGLGDTFGDAFNGEQDLAIGGGAAHTHQVATTYEICGGGHVRIGTAIPGGAGSLVAVADAAGLGAAGAIRWRGDYELSPGMVQPGYCFWQDISPLPWEEYAPGVFVQGKFQGTTTSTFQRIGQTGYIWDADWEDITLRIDTLAQRHALKGQASLASLNGSGGRGRYYAQAAFPVNQAWDAVLAFDGSAYADVTASVAAADGAGAAVLAVDAGDGARVLFGSAAPFSNAMLAFLAGGTGLGDYTGVLEYSAGAGVFGAFTNSADGSNDFKSGTPLQYGFTFNPKPDWATDTIDGHGPYYWLSWRKTGGTVTRAVQLEQTTARRDAVYIHRWNDAAPVRGATTGAGSGLRWDLDTKGNYEFVNLRICGPDFHADSNGCADITLSGVQYACFGDMQLGAADMGVTYRASSDGIRWWDQSDIKVLDPGHGIFQSILAKPGADQTKFLDSARWTDLVYCINGPYPGVGGGRWDPIVTDGVRIRKVGVRVDGLNDAGVIDLWIDDSPTDHHSLAVRGGFDADACTFERLGFEDFLRAVEIYVPATGGNDAPVSGASSSGANYRFQYGYHADWNGMADSGQPNGGFVFSGDNDRLHGYRDGSGDFSGNQVRFWYFRKIDDPAAGTAVANSSEIPVTVRDVTFEECNWQWSIGRSFGPEGCVVVVEDADAGPSYSDVTESVKPSSGAGVTAAMFPGSPAAGDACHFRFRAQFNRRLNLAFDTVAAGAFTVAWEYRKTGGTWQAVTSLAGAAAGLMASGSVTFDRPADAEAFAIGAEDFFDVRCRLASGSFATPPVLVIVTSRFVGPAIDIDRYEVINPGTGIGRIVTNRWSGTEANSAFVKDDHMACTLAPGRSAAGDFYKIGSTGVDTPDLSFAEWQALAKSKTDTDASEDSVFCPNGTMQEQA